MSLTESIDEKLLPAIVAFDSSVLIPALNPKQAAGDPACARLFEAMDSANRTILIAAPTFAEFLRGAPKSSLPRRRNVVVVPFDQLAAELLAKDFPSTVLVTLNKKSGLPRHYIKYDAMIVACAARHRAGHFVSTDDQQRELAKKIGLTVRTPSEYLTKQPKLPLAGV
jgi:predicted nucleic acid-binding protein